MYLFFFAIPIILNAQEPYKFPEEVTKEYNKITVGGFPRVELISLVQTISKYPTVLGFLMAEGTSFYKTEVFNHFKSFYPYILNVFKE